MLRYCRVCLDTFGYQLPPRILTSQEIEHRLAPLYERLRLPEGRLELMTGIRQRRLWHPGTRPSEAAIMAGKNTLEKGGWDPSTIECLIFTSVSRDMMEPATASFVHLGLGLPASCIIFDISNACLGFLDGMVMLANMIELGQVRNGLVVSGETAEELLESTMVSLVQETSLSRKAIKPAFASLTIGSGSIALVMRKAEAHERKPMLKHGSWQANTTHSDLCHGNQKGARTTLMETNSEELMHRGVDTACQTWEQFSSCPGWGKNDIDRFFCHQVGTAHARLLFERLGLDSCRNFETLATLGNVGSVSAPITMAMAIEQGAFGPGQKAALLGIGSGINCMMLGVDWREHRMDYSNEQGESLLRLARRTIAARLGGGQLPESGMEDRELHQPRATFVTLKKKGLLRGCIGNLEPVGPLWQGVRDNALNAAFHDYRFPPVTAEEIDDLHIDISILGPAVPLEYSDASDLLAKLHPGQDGVILRSGAARATFLPQVWQQLPRPEEFLDHLCRKAGLKGSAWRDSHPEIHIYRVQSFEEDR